MRGKRALYALLALLIMLVPLGLLSPDPAWGEWEESFYEKALGFVPEGIAKASGWHAPLPDYSVPGLGKVGGYYLSALLGVGVIAVLFWLIGRGLKRGRG